MDAQMIALVLAGGAALGVVVWVLAKLGKALIKLAKHWPQQWSCFSPYGW